MLKKLLFLIFSTFIFIIPMHLYAEDDKLDLTIRWGQGGFSDSRSPEGGLGGGQLALDIKPKDLPVAISLTYESYTNSPEPTHSYEISNITAINALYLLQLFNYDKLDYFFGGGIGKIKVPKGEENSTGYFSSTLYNLEAGVNFRYFKYVGFYSVIKQIKAKEYADKIKVIDFNETILILGLTFNFNLF